MSIMAILASYNAVARGNNAQFAMMQNNQARMGLANSASPSFAGSAKLAHADKNLEMNNVQNRFQAQVANAQLDSMESARKRWGQSFNYFA